MFTKLASKSDLPPVNEVKELPCNGKQVCVVNLNGEIHAMENTCLHMGGPLGEGVIEDGKVICPWHGWAWDPNHRPGSGGGENRGLSRESRGRGCADRDLRA